MARIEVAMEAKLLAVLSADLTGVSVTQLCADLGISRQSFYKYRARWAAEGPAGLVERSRAPHRSPQRIPAAVEDEIVRLRKTLRTDNGAQMIAYHLARTGWTVPAVSTIHRVLVARGMVVAAPHKRPKSAQRRFQWPRPNDAWQIDATAWALADGRNVWVMDLLDDHSRVALAARACAGPTATAAFDALCDAAARWGLPAHVMSDNGTCFTARLHGKGTAPPAPTDFERHLRALGIRHICSTPGHPQTCGKLERFHQTLKRWLATQPPARTIAALQHQLDAYLHHYNHHRPHRALHGNTPTQAWTATPPARPGPAITEDPTASLHRVSTNGQIHWRRYTIGIGTRYERADVVVIARGDDLAIFGPDGLIRRLTIDPTRGHQPTGTRPGGPRKPRVIGPRH